MWAMDQLLLLVRKHAKPVIDAATSTWTVPILQFLALHGFFSLRKSTKKTSLEALRSKPLTPFGPVLQSAFRSRFFSCVTHLVTISPKCNGVYWTTQAVETFSMFENDTKHVSALTSDAAAEERKGIQKMLVKIRGMVSSPPGNEVPVLNAVK